MTTATKQRPKYYDLNLAHLPPPGLVSIFHRVSGLLLFFPIVPALLYVLQGVLASEASFAGWHDFFSRPLVKVAALGALWLYAHHFWAGVRFLLIDLHYGVGKAAAGKTALAVFALGILSTLLIGWRLW